MYVNLTFGDQDWPQSTITAMAGFAEEHRYELRSCQREARFPADIYAAMGNRGWVGPFTPAEEGGSGLGVAEYCLIEEEVGRLGLVSPQISIQGQRWLIDWATPEQRERYLPAMARGTLIFSESISEPGVGSSMKLMRTTAVRDGDDWIINGAKTHVNLGCESQVTLVYAIAPEGITAFLVDTDLPGVSTRHTDPIGLRLIPTADVMLEDVRVPHSALLGEAGRGMDTFFSTFNMSRLGNASELIGFGRRALADAIAYGSGREVGDSVVTDFQGIQWTVADGSTKADRREVDGATVQRAAFVVSDSAEGARTEAGDLIHAAADGIFDWDDLADLADIIAGTVTPPQPGSGIVLFESQGVALQDVVIATLAHQRSEQR